MDEHQIQKIAKALADPHRRSILEMIAQAPPEPPIHCTMIVERLPISQPTVSHHIKELAAAGLIEIHNDGPYNRLELRQDILNAYFQALTAAFQLEEKK